MTGGMIQRAPRLENVNSDSIDSAVPDLHRRFLIGSARAIGGAIIFSLPLLMTMEMWSLGFYMNRARLALLLSVMTPLLVRLSYHAGFEETFDWKNDVVDAFVALAIGFISSALLLLLLGIVTSETALDSAIGMVSLQAVPAAFGAMLAQAQFGKRDGEAPEKRVGYWDEIFLMGAGALFLALNVAPTEEMILIAYKMTEWHAIALLLLSVLLMHAFVYAVEFRGAAGVPEGTPQWSVFLRFTVVGYVVALVISVYALWTFGRTDGLPVDELLKATLVLGFPSAIGASAARLIL
jgi:putative integral membrane protein (TIGR02587 family)